jgi:undecaprenyl-diphosphatase
MRRINSNLEKLAMLWGQRVSSNFTLLTMTVAIAGLIGCTLLLWAMERIFSRVVPLQIFTMEVETLRWFHKVATPFLDTLMLAVTRLCNPAVALPVGLATLVILLARQAYLEAWIFVIAGLGAILLNRVLKPIFARPRPTLYPPLVQEKTFSLPSGHALGAMVLYGMIAYLLAEYYPQRAIWIYLLTGILVLAVGLSRLYLGVHWPTDVLAGWGIGFLWLATCITMLRLQKLKGRQHQCG